mmetsp:Transcript_5738/g.12550  ORF Transcript_5738/g.12550 Transcript_5738/m.12550 type:complete len:304 (-) Transcript_5738:87-998(-)
MHHPTRSCQIDDELCRVVLRRNTVLRCGVVERVFVVPVVPPLAEGGNSYERILRRVGSRVVGAISPQVSRRIHKPCAVQDVHIPQGSGSEKRCPERLAPPVLRNKRRHEEAPEKVPPRVEILLKHHAAILLEVINVYSTASLSNTRVLLEVQPANVGEPKAPDGVVRISNSLGVEMVRAVVPRPVVDGALICDAVCKHSEETVNEACLVAAMRPEAVGTTGDAESTNRPENEGPCKCCNLAIRQEKKAHETKNLCDSDVPSHAPPNVLHRPWRQAPLLAVRNRLFLCVHISERALLSCRAREN